MTGFISVFLAVATLLLIVFAAIISAAYVAIWAVERISSTTFAIILFLLIVTVLSTAIYYA